jgi:hypothetical protein
MVRMDEMGIEKHTEKRRWNYIVAKRVRLYPNTGMTALAH